MDPARKALIEAAVRLAAAAPAEVVDQLARGIVGRLSVAAAAGARDVVEQFGNPRLRALTLEFAETWAQAAGQVSAAEAAMALWTASATDASVKEDQRIELVWTGPATPSIPARRTDEVLAGMIDEAKHSITLSSFGVFPVVRIAEGLRAAALRGVAVRVVLGDRPDDADWLDWRNERAFGQVLPANFAIYEWPVERRLRDGAGNQGLMHAKCAVADRRHLFLTSANLTGNALTINMELGVSIHGAAAAEQVERHFDDLIARRELVVRQQ